MERSVSKASIFRSIGPQLSRCSSYLLHGGGDEDSRVITIPPEATTLDGGISIRSLTSYGSIENSESTCRFIRFQVVVWYVGRPDEVLGRVEMKFRVTCFWNAPEESDSQEGYGMNNPNNKKVWTMHGRQRAYQRDLKDITDGNAIVYVPPVSILNAVDFETLGEPEVCLINSEEKLMKWSCLYKASLLQESMNVASFPHDSHELVLRLAVLKHRQRRKRWDKSRWKLALATKDDTQGTISVPYGTIVNHVKVPGFSYGNEGLQFEFIPMDFGSKDRLEGEEEEDRDYCLQVKLGVKRESAYYDRNIIPLLAALNLVAICIVYALDASHFGARGEMILAISFVEIGIRMTTDSRLPVVGYQIKMQYILNNLFLALVALVAESSFAYLLFDHKFDNLALWLDQFAAALGISHLIMVLSIYYSGSGNVVDRTCFTICGKWLQGNGF